MNDVDLDHLRRCVALAAEAADRGDDPFGSVLVSGDGAVLAERSNEVVTTDDCTELPELALAVWASQHLDAVTRAAATMYTSGEHCPMCAAAHVRSGIGRLVDVLSSPMIAELVEPGISIGLRASASLPRRTSILTSRGRVTNSLPRPQHSSNVTDDHRLLRCQTARTIAS